MEPLTPPPHDPVAATWRDQLIELDLPGVGPITACAALPPVADAPALRPAPTSQPGPGPEPGSASRLGPDPEPDEQDAEGIDRRRQEPTAPPTSPPAARAVRATLAARPPLELAHTWLVVPALGPVLPALGGEGVMIGDISGRTAPFEVRPDTPQGPPGATVRPSSEGVRAGAPLPEAVQREFARERRRAPVRPMSLSWFRRIVVADELRRRGGPIALGALVGRRRDWFEPAAAAREDRLASHPDQALETALRIAVDQGQPAVLRLGPGGLDVIPTGSDPRVPALEGLPLLVTARPAQCPLQGCDGAGPCRPVGGPWIRRSMEAQRDWEARRSQALAVQDCAVCFGEALPPEPDQVQVPRPARRTAVPEITRLHLRSGEVVRIHPLAPPR